MTARDIVMGAAGAASTKTYIEDVFNTTLYTGNGTSQTITNGIDLSGKGGLVWFKGRNIASDHAFFDTARGAGTSSTDNRGLTTSSSEVENSLVTDYLSAFSSTGFTVTSGGASTNVRRTNYTSSTYAAWTFRKEPKFFDVVTYTGNGTAGKTVSHSLGQTPGMIIIKRRFSSNGWVANHRSLANIDHAIFPDSDLAETGSYWNSTSPTSTNFTLSSSAQVNASGGTYVAYLFAHDTTTDGLIQCGSYTGNGSTTGPSVNLGWEPQFIIIKNASGVGNWQMFDNMRSVATGYVDASVLTNSPTAESVAANYLSFTSTGFQITGTSADVNNSAATYVYMAIRRGPMKTPTDGTKVFQPVVRTGSGTASVVNTTITPDLVIHKVRNTTGGSPYWLDRLRDNYQLFSDSSQGTLAESSGTPSFPVQMWDNQTGYDIAGTGTYINSTSYSYIDWVFKRAPGFFDIVNVPANAETPHNLGVVPELVITKTRPYTGDWYVLYKNNSNNASFSYLNKTTVFSNSGAAYSSYFTSNVITSSAASTWTGFANPTIYYLFASCPGVSKVGTYTGNGSSQTINCGFTAGARFVLIKRTDSTGDWYVWDTARGIVTANDPHLSLNSTAAEVTTDDSLDPDNTGFIVNQVTATNVNVNTATYLYLAIA